MRDSERIPDFMCALGDIWRSNLPDWRFGQLMFNFISEVGDPFYFEEEVFLSKFRFFVEGLSRSK